MSADINSVELDTGSEVVVYGHRHTVHNLKSERPVVEELMEDSDELAVEHLGYDKELEAGVSTSDFYDDKYGDRVLELAEPHFERVWGPDSYQEPYYFFGTGLPILASYGIAISKMYRLSKDQESSSGYDTSEKYDDSEFLSRREMMAGGAGILGMQFIGMFDYIMPDVIERELDEKEFTASPNYNDAREVFIAEGLQRIAKIESGSQITGIFGKAHSDSIANYLRNPVARREKMEFYSGFLPEEDTMMTRWDRTGQDEWTLEQVYDLLDNSKRDAP